MNFYSYYIDGTNVNQYLFDAPSIAIKGDGDINPFIIEPSSLTMRFQKVTTIRNLLVNESYLTILKNGSIIWSGYYDIMYETEDEGINIITGKFAPDISMLKKDANFGGTNGSALTHLNLIISASNYLDSLEDDGIFSELGAIERYVSLKANAPASGYSYYNPTNPFLSLSTGDEPVVALKVKDASNNIYKQNYLGGIEFYAPLQPIGSLLEDVGDAIDVEYFGYVWGWFLEIFEHPTPAGTKIFMFNDDVWVYTFHSFWNDFGIEEMVEPYKVISDIAYLTDRTAIVINKKLIFVSINNQFSLTSKVFNHQKSKVLLEYNYEMQTPNNNYYDTMLFERLKEFNEQKYQDGIFDKHSFLIPDAETLIIPLGETLVLNGTNYGRITEINYQPKSNTIKLVTIERDANA